MKKILVSALIVVMACGFARAGIQDKKLGLGIVFLYPTGISFKTWSSEKGAIQGTLSWSYRNDEKLVIHIGFLKHAFDAIYVKKGSLPFYYGGGTMFKSVDTRDGIENRLGVSGTAGLAYIFDTEPLEIFLECGPVLDIAPAMRVEFIGGLGVHYYF